MSLENHLSLSLSLSEALSHTDIRSTLTRNETNRIETERNGMKRTRQQCSSAAFNQEDELRRRREAICTFLMRGFSRAPPLLVRCTALHSTLRAHLRLRSHHIASHHTLEHVTQCALPPTPLTRPFLFECVCTVFMWKRRTVSQ